MSKPGTSSKASTNGVKSCRAKVGKSAKIGKSVGLLHLLVISRSDVNTCRRILKLTKKTDLNALFGLAKNILIGNVRVSSSLLEELRPFERDLLGLSERTTSLEKKLKSLRKTKFLRLILDIYERVLFRAEKNCCLGEQQFEEDSESESEDDEVKADAPDSPKL